MPSSPPVSRLAELRALLRRWVGWPNVAPAEAEPPSLSLFRPGQNVRPADGAELSEIDRRIAFIDQRIAEWAAKRPVSRDRRVA